MRTHELVFSTLIPQLQKLIIEANNLNWTKSEIRSYVNGYLASMMVNKQITLEQGKLLLEQLFPKWDYTEELSYEI